MEIDNIKRTQLMGEQKLLPLLMRFSIPAVIGMMVQALYNVVDRVYIGRAVGSVGIAATTVSMPMMMLGFAFGVMIGIGATALVSIKLGEQRKDQAEEIVGNSVVLLLFLSILFVVLGLHFLTPALKIFGATDTILPYARSYMRIIITGWLFQMIGFGLNNFIRGEGNPKIAMLTMIIGAVLNMVLDPIFIFGLNWGLEGAAVATVISQAISALWVLYYFLGTKSTLKIRVKYFRLKWPIVFRIMAIGSAPFLLHISETLNMALFNTQLKIHGGDLGISLMGVIISLMMLIFMFIMGVSQGSQPIIGYNYGALKYNRAKKTMGLALVIVGSVVFIGYLLIMLFPAQIIRIFIKNDQELVSLGIHAFPIFFSLLPLVGFQAVASNFFQALGKAKQAVFLVLSRTVLLQVPCILILPRFFGLDGVWLTTPVSIFGSTLITGFFLLVLLQQLREKRQ